MGLELQPSLARKRSWARGARTGTGAPTRGRSCLWRAAGLLLGAAAQAGCPGARAVPAHPGSLHYRPPIPNPPGTAQPRDATSAEPGDPHGAKSLQLREPRNPQPSPESALALYPGQDEGSAARSIAGSCTLGVPARLFAAQTYEPGHSLADPKTAQPAAKSGCFSLQREPWEPPDDKPVTHPLARKGRGNCWDTQDFQSSLYTV